MDDMTTILDKIRKLLALSTSSNPNEAAVAAAKAQKLLMQYNLDISQIDTGEKKTADYDKARIDTAKRVWRRQLLVAIARSMFCDTVDLRGTSVSYLVGEAHNREAVIELYHVLTGQLQSMGLVAYTKSNSSMHAKTWLDAFYMGAVERIWERLQEQQQAMQQASNDCRALVVVKDAELKEAMHRFFPKVRPSAPKRLYSSNGYNEGREAGNRVSFQKALPSMS